MISLGFQTVRKVRNVTNYRTNMQYLYIHMYKLRRVKSATRRHKIEARQICYFAVYFDSKIENIQS